MLHALLLAITRAAVRLYYRESHLGAQVPTQGPLLLVGNHPNGLVDPIVLAGTTHRRLRFLGKAPLFEMPVIGSIMRGLEALPVYRAQDGAGTADNRHTFGAVFEALAAGDVVCLFPEGISHSEPDLQRLKTGTARMALGAEENGAFRLGVRVVPVGLVYESKRRFRSRVSAWVGEPIAVADLESDYQEDPWRAVEALTQRLEEGLREVTLNLDRWEDLPLIDLAQRIDRARNPSLAGTEPADDPHRIERWRAFAEGVRHLRHEDPEAVEALAGRIAAFRERLAGLGLQVEDLTLEYRAGPVLRFAVANGIRLFVGLPLALLGTLGWFLPYHAVRWLARFGRPTRDTFATVHILAGLLVFPAWLVGLGVLVGLEYGLLAALIAPAGLAALGLFALRFAEWRAGVLEDIAVFFRLGFRTRLQIELQTQRAALGREIDGLRERYLARQPLTDSR